MRLIHYSYTRDDNGRIVNYHPSPLANTIHTFTGGGWTTDQFVGVVYER